VRKDFEKILDKCIARIASGEADIESCLNEYPEYAAQLRPLLEIAMLLYKEPQPQPRPDVVSRGEGLLRDKVLEKRRSKTPRRGLARVIVDKIGIGRSAARRVPLLPKHSRLRWVVTFAGIVALVAIGVGVIAASSHSMPGDVLYPVKIAAEQFRLMLTPSEESKGEFHIALAERRMQEIAEMSRRGETGEVAKLVSTVSQHLEKAGEVIVATGEGEVAEELKTKLEESAVQQLAALEGALHEADEETKPVITQALQTSGDSYGTALEDAIASAPLPPVVGDMGTIQVLVTDPPPPQAIDSVIVEVARIQVHLAAGSDSKWVTIVDETMSFDLMELVGGKEVSLGSNEVNAGTYTQVRMDITHATVIVGEDEHDAFVPSGRLKFVRPFQVQENGTTTLLLDFDGQRSINVTGKGQYILKPVVTLLVPEQTGSHGVAQDEETDELEFMGTIETIDGTTWTMAIEGESKMVDVSGADIEGEPAVGLEAEVGATVVGNSILASKVEIREPEQEVARRKAEQLALILALLNF